MTRWGIVVDWRDPKIGVMLKGEPRAYASRFIFEGTFAAARREALRHGKAMGKNFRVLGMCKLRPDQWDWRH